MDYLLGEEMSKIIQSRGTTFKTFADRLGMTDRNLQNVFKWNDFSTEQLKRASKILEHKFIDYLANPTRGEKFLNSTRLKAESLDFKLL